MRKKSVLLGLAVLCCLLSARWGQAYAVSENSLSVSAKAAVLLEADTGRILYEKNKDQQLSMASTTKIMTALIALESGNLDEPFTVDAEAIRVEGSSMGLREGDIVTLRTLVCGMLLPSGNDAANAGAVRVAGSVEEFASLMNRRAEAIGMENTHFVTPSGLDDDAHYSTAHDMAKLARVAISNSLFREISSRSTVQVSFGNPPYNRWLTNHNRLLKEYKGAIGLKTGFTKKSGRCLVSAAERDGVRLIAVTLNAPNDWQDHTKMLDYGFRNVKPISLPINCTALMLQAVGGVKETFGVTTLTIPTVNVAEQDLSRITQKVVVSPFYYAPIRAGDAVGQVELYLDGEKIGGCTLIAKEGVEQRITEIKLSFWEKLQMWFSRILDRIKGYLSILS